MLKASAATAPFLVGALGQGIGIAHDASARRSTAAGAVGSDCQMLLLAFGVKL
jgi:hypothetical protein